jgi:hypothetical protein
MVIFNIVAGPGLGDGRGGGPIAAIVTGLFFSVPTVLLLRARNLFQEGEIARPED